MTDPERALLLHVAELLHKHLTADGAPPWELDKLADLARMVERERLPAVNPVRLTHSIRG